MTPEVRWAICIMEDDLEGEQTFMAALRYAFLRSVSLTSIGTLSCHYFIKSDIVIEEGKRGR
jgi:hypothetical protein